MGPIGPHALGHPGPPRSFSKLLLWQHHDTSTVPQHQEVCQSGLSRMRFWSWNAWACLAPPLYLQSSVQRSRPINTHLLRVKAWIGVQLRQRLLSYSSGSDRGGRWQALQVTHG
jgi:hypothetical protein